MCGALEIKNLDLAPLIIVQLWLMLAPLWDTCVGRDEQEECWWIALCETYEDENTHVWGAVGGRTDRKNM